MTHTVHRIFSTPVISFKFSQHHKYKFPEVRKANKNPNNWPMPINTSYPNIHDHDPIVSVEVRDQLRKELSTDITNVLSEMNIHNEFVMTHLWYNIYHDHQGIHPHNHLSDCQKKNPFWCGIYYNKNATPTHFMRHDEIICRTQEFPNWLESTISDCFMPKFIPEVSDGDVFLFPAYLQHSVYQKSMKMRMTFAFNIHLKD